MRKLILSAFLLLSPATVLADPVTAKVDGVAVALTPAARGFDQPVFLASPPVGDKRIFVVEKTGRIRIIKDGVVAARPFLDIHKKVLADNEQGLLSVAFDPGYASNGRFFVDYVDLHTTVHVEEYRVSSDPDVADAGSAKPILTIKKQRPYHNGGWLAFGPDKYLYVSVGDDWGKYAGNAQNTNILLGKILRIDVDGGSPYAIPPSNPFAKGGGAPEIYHYGLRNPWRPSFDGDTLYIADVGENNWEEVDVVPLAPGGQNFGWPKMEGEKCFLPSSGCDPSKFTLPVYVYSHDNGCAIVGGYVYRGKALPELAGRYFFGDNCSGGITSFRYANGKAGDVVNLADDLGSIGIIDSFGEDSDGELYVLIADGTILKVVRAP